jgi:hypothetical protein
MSQRDWQTAPFSTIREQRLVDRAQREIEMARRAPQLQGIVEHCQRALDLIDELARLAGRQR